MKWECPDLLSKVYRIHKLGVLFWGWNLFLLRLNESRLWEHLNDLNLALPGELVDIQYFHWRF